MKGCYWQPSLAKKEIDLMATFDRSIITFFLVTPGYPTVSFEGARIPHMDGCEIGFGFYGLHQVIRLLQLFNPPSHQSMGLQLHVEFPL